MNKKPIDAKSLQEKLEGLYSGKDLSKDDDKKILRAEKAGITTKDKWNSFSEEEREELKSKQLQNRDTASWREKNKAKNQSLKVSKKLSESQKKRYSNPDKKKKHQEGINEFWSSEENRKSKAEFHKSKKFLKAIDNRSKNPEFGKKISAAKKKPIHVPWGDYPSKADAMLEGKKLGVKDVDRKIMKGLKTDPDNFYYHPLDKS